MSRSDAAEMEVGQCEREAMARAIIEAGIVPAELAPLVGIVLQQIGGDDLKSMIADAQRARGLMDEGKSDEARELIEKYREVAEAHGLGPMFDQIRDGID